MEDDLVAVVALLEVVDAAEVEEELEVQLGVVAQQRGRLDPGLAVDRDGEVAAPVADVRDARAQPLEQDAGRGVRRSGGRGRAEPRPRSC